MIKAHFKTPRCVTQTAAIVVLTSLLASPLFAQGFQSPGATTPSTSDGQEQFWGTTSSAILRGPVDETVYVVGPGDRFSVTLWGRSIQEYSAYVTPEGDLVLPGIAVVPVSGKTLEKAKELIQVRISSRYKNTESSVALTGLRKMKVNVLGNVSKPGIYLASALDRASELIQAAGGLKEGASRRNIQVERRTGEREQADLLRYEVTADLASNPPVLDGDVIHVPFAKAFVYAYGAVETPGQYELVDGETIASLIDVAGGFARGAAADTVEIRMFVDSAETVSEFVDVSRSPGESRPLTDGDQIYVRAIPDWREINSVTVSGEVLYPGTYGINRGTAYLSRILERSGGITEEASVEEAKLIRSAGIDEIDLEFERLKKIPIEEMTDTEYAYFKTKSRERRGVVVVEFAKVLDGRAEEDVLLKGGDKISIPKRRETVSVSGQVANPGKVVYVPGKKYGYYIERAGGYTADAQSGKTRVIKSASGEWMRAKDADALVPGDAVWAPEKPERDWWELTKDFVQFTASIATIYLVIDQATSN